MFEDFQNRSLHKPIGPVAMIPWKNYYRLTLRVGNGSLPETIEFMEKTWQRFVPRRPFSYYFLDDSFEFEYRREMRARQFLTLFSGMAIFVSCLGLLGLISFAIELRTKEIGVRRVLGAESQQIVGLLLREFGITVAIANLIAWPIAYFIVSDWLRNFAIRVDLSPWIFLVAGGTTVLAALVTIGYQTIRASRMDPVGALRYE